MQKTPTSASKQDTSLLLAPLLLPPDTRFDQPAMTPVLNDKEHKCMTLVLTYLALKPKRQWVVYPPSPPPSSYWCQTIMKKSWLNSLCGTSNVNSFVFLFLSFCYTARTDSQQSGQLDKHDQRNWSIYYQCVDGACRLSLKVRNKPCTRYQHTANTTSSVDEHYLFCWSTID